MNGDVAIVTAADDRYFDLLRGLICSIQDKPQSAPVALVVLDVGLSDASRTWLRVRGVAVRTVDWPHPHPAASAVPGFVHAFAARCRLPSLNPGHRIHVWIDADAWIQDWSALDALVAAAREHGFAAVPELDFAYPLAQILEIHRGSVAPLLRPSGDEGALSRPANVGCFAGRADSPVWDVWRSIIDDGIAAAYDTGKLFLFDQSALSVALARIGNGPGAGIAWMAARFNWLCHLALPAVDAAGTTLVRPIPPHEPLGIVHLTAQTKNAWLELPRIGGGKVSRSLRYESPSTLPRGDYVAPGLSVIRPDRFFPDMHVADRDRAAWPHLRREVPHNCYADRRLPTRGFLNRDEAQILYNTALRFAGRPALEIGCLWGWSAFHLIAGGVRLDVIDPLLAREEVRDSVRTSLLAGQPTEVRLIPARSPDAIHRLAPTRPGGWSLFFIHGDHEGEAPLADTIACAGHAAPDAAMLFHDLASPNVAAGPRWLASRGWKIRIYHTTQIMAVAWRGDVEPVAHRPDPDVDWQIPAHLGDLM
jgi:hypothetical protein